MIITTINENEEEIKRPVSPLKIKDDIDYKNIKLLKKFITKNGKILSNRITHLTLKQQNHVKKAIKYARILNLLPFVKSKKLK